MPALVPRNRGGCRQAVGAGQGSSRLAHASQPIVTARRGRPGVLPPTSPQQRAGQQSQCPGHPGGHLAPTAQRRHSARVGPGLTTMVRRGLMTGRTGRSAGDGPTTFSIPRHRAATARVVVALGTVGEDQLAELVAYRGLVAVRKELLVDRDAEQRDRGHRRSSSLGPAPRPDASGRPHHGPRTCAPAAGLRQRHFRTRLAGPLSLTV